MVAAVRRAALAVLGQKRALLQALPSAQYTASCPAAGNATIGQHLRHSLDHYSRCLAAAADAAADAAANPATVIRYDQRARGTAVEADVDAASKEVDRLIRAVESLPDAALAAPVAAAFVLSAEGEGEEQPLASTVGRELGFVTHHAIHHHALIKTMAGQLGLDLDQIPDFGMAPSTAHHRKTTGG